MVSCAFDRYLSPRRCCRTTDGSLFQLVMRMERTSTGSCARRRRRVEGFFDDEMRDGSAIVIRRPERRTMPHFPAVGPNPTMEKPRKPRKRAPGRTWDSLPIDVHLNILQRLEFGDLFRFKAVSREGKDMIESDVFKRLRAGKSGSEGSFTGITYYIKNKLWRWSGFDLHSNSWREFPPLSYLPAPDPDLFKEYSVCGDGGLMCAEVSKFPKKGEFVVFNSLTGNTKALPPLIHPRRPVLVHLAVDSATKSYKVIVAGSAAVNDEHLSNKMEVFDSSTGKWTEVCDLPGPVFGLNEHQAGVCLNGVLFFISFLEGFRGRGVLAFDINKEQWVEKLAYSIPWSTSSNTLQLVENDGQLYVFSEQERGATVEQCIDELELPNADGGHGICQWRNVVRAKKSGGRGLLVYPEYTCVSFGKRKLCIFNTLNRDGVVYDVRDGHKCELGLDPPPANQTGDTFFTMNPATFSIQPNFDSDPGLLASLSAGIAE